MRVRIYKCYVIVNMNEYEGEYEYEYEYKSEYEC